MKKVRHEMGADIPTPGEVPGHEPPKEMQEKWARGEMNYTDEEYLQQL